MTLDKLYSVIKKAEFPIRSREELAKLIGDNIINFEGHEMSAEEIAVHIARYPIHNVAEFFKDFLEEEVVAYNLDEADILGKFEARSFEE